jgi:hypothetical protein
MFATQASQNFGSSPLNCSSCVETLQVAAQCTETNSCNLTTCYGASTFNSCCPACRDELKAATTCVGECSDSCVYSTTTAYATCLSTTRGCMPKCQVALSAYATTIDNGTYYNVTYEDLQNADLTCQSIHDDYVTEACGIAECCPACVGDFEAIMNCLVNEVVAELVPSLKGEVCDTTCSARRLRFLQNANGGGSIGGGLFDKGSDRNNSHNGNDGLGFLNPCRKQLARQLAFGDVANAAQDYTSCLQGQMMILWTTAGNGTNHSTADVNQTINTTDTSNSSRSAVASASLSLALLFVLSWF